MTHPFPVRGGHLLGGPMIEADVVLSWFSSATSALPSFTRPTRVIQLPTPAGQKYGAQIASFGQTPILNILKKYAPDVRPLRIAVLGFSEGCQGARELLRSPDGGRVDTAIAIDGIHAQYQPGSTTKVVPAYLTPWGAMAARAAQGRTLMIVTASSVRPPGFASTTETAAWLWRYVTGSDADQATEPVPGTIVQPLSPPIVLHAGSDKAGNHWPEITYTDPPVSKYRRDRGFVIINYTDMDPTGHQDHIFQAQAVLPEVLRTYLAQRWNEMDPKGGICVLSAPEQDVVDPSGCFPPSALTDLYVSGQADPKPLDIPLDSEVDATIPGSTPPQTTSTPSQPSAMVTFAKWAGGILGAALVLEAGRRIGNAILAARK